MRLSGAWGQRVAAPAHCYASSIRDHDHLSRVFVRAMARYQRRAVAYHHCVLCGQQSDDLLLLARQAIGLVVRLCALHPMVPLLERLPVHGPLHRPDD